MGAIDRQLTVYVRRGCFLCMDMVMGLDILQEELQFRFIEVDVDRDESLVASYGARVPVLACGDTELCHFHLDAARVREWCAESGRSP